MDSEGRVRVLFDCQHATKTRLDKLPHGTRVMMFNGLLPAVLDAIDKHGMAMLYAVMEGRVTITEIKRET